MSDDTNSTSITQTENESIKIYQIAGYDGKCYQCSEYVMSCGCWFKGLDFSFLEDNSK